MKLKPVIKKELKVTPTAPQKTNKQENKLPPAGYTPMFPPIRFLARETPSSKDPMKTIKQYLELSVKRFEDDEENAPTVYIQMYQESEFYTGYLKGKTVYLPLEMLYTLMEHLEDLSEECDKRHIVD